MHCFYPDVRDLRDVTNLFIEDLQVALIHGSIVFDEGYNVYIDIDEAEHET